MTTQFLTIDDAGAVAFWMSFQALAADTAVMRVRVDASNELTLNWRDATNVFEVNYDTGGDLFQCNVSATEDSSWHHYVVAWNVTENYKKVYLDGTQQCTDTYGGTYTGTPTTQHFCSSAGGQTVAHVQAFRNTSAIGPLADEISRLRYCPNTGLRQPGYHNTWFPLWENSTGSPIAIVGADGTASSTPDPVDGPSPPRWCGPSP